MTEQQPVPLTQKLRRTAEVVFHPDRVRQEALGGLYSSAVDKLRHGAPEFFTAREGWGVKDLRVDYTTEQQGHIVITTSDVSDDGVMPENPASLLIGGDGFAPYPESAYHLSRDEQGRYGIELRVWDGKPDEGFKFRASMGRQLTELLDTEIPRATRWYRKPPQG